MSARRYAGRRYTPPGTPVAERLIAMSEPSDNGCRLWIATTDRRGYGRLRFGRHNYAHRVSYETFVGPIPEGMTVDHLCFVPGCINPEHLRLLTKLENDRNQRRALRTHCDKGHEYTPENTRYEGRGGRRRLCVICRREIAREGWRRRNGYYERRREQAAA